MSAPAPTPSPPPSTQLHPPADPTPLPPVRVVWRQTFPNGAVVEYLA